MVKPNHVFAEFGAPNNNAISEFRRTKIKVAVEIAIIESEAASTDE
jgi:hypothetical protein